MLLESFAQDTRVGLRVLIKEKGFCALAVFVLALGICAVTTQYAIVNGVLLHAFTFRDSDRLVDVQMVDPKNFTPSNFNSRITTMDFVELKERQTAFSDFVGYLNGSTVNVTYNGQPYRWQGGYVTHDFFRVLGVAPALGRDFLPEEDRPGVDKAVLLSDALWRSDFGADPHVLGKSVRVNGRAGVVVGVMPPKFSFPGNEQLWIPVNAEFPVKPRSDRGINFIAIIARMKPGISLEQAQQDVGRVAQQFAEQFPDTNKQFTMGYVRPLIHAFTGPQLTGLLLTMLTFCIVVLLIACANVMNMQFARATLRAKELAIRSSLGASRVRLVRQMLTESLILAALGGALGVGASFYTADLIDVIVHQPPNPIPSWMTFTIDGKVIVAVAVVIMLSAVISGFIPAWVASRASAIDVLKEGGRGNTGRVVGVITKGLVVAQIVFTAVLLVAALLFTQSIVRQQALDYGYDTASILSARLGLMEGDYPTSEKRQAFYDSLVRELRATPQFEAAALTGRREMVFAGGSPVEIEGHAYKNDDERENAQSENVTPGYFDVLKVKLLEGRDFTDQDSDQREPLAIVNAKFSKKYFGHESALGRRFRTTTQNGSNPGPWRKIVGVVADVRMTGPFPNARADGSGYYVPYFATTFGPVAAAPVVPQFGTVIVRPPTGQRADALARTLQATINKVDVNLPLYFVGTPKNRIEGYLTQQQVIAAMFGIFGAVAVLLASVGLYGVMSFSVNQRTQEFGIRMALGADPRSIVGMVLRQGGFQIVLGLVVGFAIALLAATIFNTGIRGFLTEISPRDPLTYMAVALLLIVVSLVATLVPARRATRVDPMNALRAE